MKDCSVQAVCPSRCGEQEPRKRKIDGGNHGRALCVCIVSTRRGSPQKRMIAAKDCCFMDGSRKREMERGVALGEDEEERERVSKEVEREKNKGKGDR